MSMEELPPEAQQFMRRIWNSKQPLVMHMLPKDAWIILGILQYATRNPGLRAEHKELIERFGRVIQSMFEEVEPDSAPYLEKGWNPVFDMPRD